MATTRRISARSGLGQRAAYVDGELVEGLLVQVRGAGRQVGGPDGDPLGGDSRFSRVPVGVVAGSAFLDVRASGLGGVVVDDPVLVAVGGDNGQLLPLGAQGGVGRGSAEGAAHSGRFSTTRSVSPATRPAISACCR
ncbi:hypothetical protein [Kitasatospora griseola]